MPKLLYFLVATLNVLISAEADRRSWLQTAGKMQGLSGSASSPKEDKGFPLHMYLPGPQLGPPHRSPKDEAAAKKDAEAEFLACQSKCLQ